MNIKHTAALALASALTVSLMTGCSSDKSSPDEAPALSTVASSTIEPSAPDASIESPSSTATAEESPDTSEPSATSGSLVTPGDEWVEESTDDMVVTDGVTDVQAWTYTSDEGISALSAQRVEYSVLGATDIDGYVQAMIGVESTKISDPADGYIFTSSAEGVGEAAGYILDLGDGSAYIISLFPATDVTRPMLDDVAATFAK